MINSPHTYEYLASAQQPPAGDCLPHPVQNLESNWFCGTSLHHPLRRSRFWARILWGHQPQAHCCRYGTRYMRQRWLLYPSRCLRWAGQCLFQQLEEQEGRLRTWGRGSKDANPIGNSRAFKILPSSACAASRSWLVVAVVSHNSPTPASPTQTDWSMPVRKKNTNREMRETYLALQLDAWTGRVCPTQPCQIWNWGHVRNLIQECALFEVPLEFRQQFCMQSQSLTWQ